MSLGYIVFLNKLPIAKNSVCFQVDDEFEGVTTFTVEHSFDLGTVEFNVANLVVQAEAKHLQKLIKSSSLCFLVNSFVVLCLGRSQNFQVWK